LDHLFLIIESIRSAGALVADAGPDTSKTALVSEHWRHTDGLSVDRTNVRIGRSMKRF